MVDYINKTDLSPRRKTELLIELTHRRRTMLQGGFFMLHAKVKFDDLDRALKAFNRRNNSDSLGAVEAALQTQIEVIRRINDESILSNEDKALCLYTLQNMIFGLSDVELPNGRKSDYMPHILQEQYQMMLKGANLNMDWDSLHDSVYTSEYRVRNHPVMSDWNFLDYDVIESNLKSMAAQKFNMPTTKVTKAPEKPNQHGGIVKGELSLEKCSDAEINKVINQALVKFDANDLKDNLHELYNFVKGTLEAQDENIDYAILHEVVVATMHRIVEIGSEQQRRILDEQSQTEGRTL